MHPNTNASKHPCTHRYTLKHTISSIKEWPNRQPTCPCTSSASGVSVQHVCSSPPCLCHVFRIKVLAWWAPAGGRVGAVSQGCACGPNPLINSASAGRRWQVGTETGCTPPIFLPLSDPEIPLTSICSLLLMDCCWSVLTAPVCVVSAHEGCAVVYVYMFSLPIVSSRVLTLFSSVVYLMKTDERCDLYRAVASAVTYKHFSQTHLYSK